MSSLKGRVALVSGGARGIGAATARALAKEGASVVITDVIDGSEVAKEIGGAFLKHDVTVEADWADAVAFAKTQFGGLDILVNNAGVFWVAPLLQTDLERFRRMQAVNVDGVFLGMKHAVPAIAERAHQWEGGGAIINLSSVAGLKGSPGVVAYNASKGAVRLMTKSIALEVAPLKIRVNSVHPGVIDTLMGGQVITEFAGGGGVNDPDVSRSNVAAMHPLGRLGKPTEIADAIVFLASDKSAFITGMEMVVDGGMTQR
ncbi:MAG: SDR family oxidoreductase [Alphaproteobacteria bacterium]|nr:SDR family oxidoreductase [Alphaproteobacteria bacterium]